MFQEDGLDSKFFENRSLDFLDLKIIGVFEKKVDLGYIYLKDFKDVCRYMIIYKFLFQ